MSQDQSASTPAFQRIKEDILTRIRSGEWQEGEMIPGETTLAQTFGVSRMTVNRAVRELTAERAWLIARYLERVEVYYQGQVAA